MGIKRGDIYYADLTPVVGSEQGGTRSVLIIQNDMGNRHSPTVIAAAITSRQKRNRSPPTSGWRTAPAGWNRNPQSCWSRCAPLTVPG